MTLGVRRVSCDRCPGGGVKINVNDVTDLDPHARNSKSTVHSLHATHYICHAHLTIITSDNLLISTVLPITKISSFTVIVSKNYKLVFQISEYAHGIYVDTPPSIKQINIFTEILPFP